MPSLLVVVLVVNVPSAPVIVTSAPPTTPFFSSTTSPVIVPLLVCDRRVTPAIVPKNKRSVIRCRGSIRKRSGRRVVQPVTVVISLSFLSLSQTQSTCCTSLDGVDLREEAEVKAWILRLQPCAVAG